MTTRREPGILPWRSCATFSGARTSLSPHSSRVGTATWGTTSPFDGRSGARDREVPLVGEPVAAAGRAPRGERVEDRDPHLLLPGVPNGLDREAGGEHPARERILVREVVGPAHVERV